MVYATAAGQFKIFSGGGFLFNGSKSYGSPAGFSSYA